MEPLDTSIDQGDERFANVAPLSDDWYHGHKVVAMPSSAFGGKTIREVVSSRNEHEQHDRPRRSSSLGRPSSGGERRDLVQDVYDRMGVSYSRSMAYESNNNNINNYNNNYDQQQQDTPLAIQSHPSFSDSIASSITNSLQPPQQQQQQYVTSNTGGGKMKDKFSGRYRAAAAVSAATRSGDRGRARTPVVDESEGQKRARSLSRGRSVKGTWPPSREQAVANANAELYGGSTTNPAGSTTSELSTPPSPDRRTGAAVTAVTAAPKHKRSHSFDARPQYGRGRTGSGFRSPGTASGSNNNNGAIHKYQPNPQSYTNNRMRITSPLPGDFNGNNNQADNNSMRDEKKENDEVSQSISGEGEAAPPAIPSIKDRISAFAGPTEKKASTGGGQRNSRRNTYGGPSSTGYMKSPPPPKVDIYEQSNRKHDEGYGGHPDDTTHGVEPHENRGEDGYSQGPPEPSSIPPSAAAAAAADVATKYMRPSQTKKSHRTSTGGGGTGGVRAGSSLANSYLTGITSPGGTTSNRPVFQHPTGSFGGEVPFGASEEGPDGQGSVGANSAVSYGDASASRKSSQPWQKTSNSYSSNSNNIIRNTSSMVSSGNSTSHNHSLNGGTIAVSPEMIEKMVDERVQVQLREVEARMEGLLRRWMDQMNTKITTRLDSMESSIKDSMPDPYRRREL